VSLLSRSLFALILTPVLVGTGIAETPSVKTEMSQTKVEMTLASKALYNEAAYIPSQCYTKTQDDHGNVYNPCYTCHVESKQPNFINDHDLQTAYDFPEYATRNRWTNLFEDRSDKVAAISDSEIPTYVRESNYRDNNGNIILSETLREVPADWDYNGDGKWSGFVPDCHFDFDEAGFDRTPSGGYSGWRTFSYTPFPGTFWPTNGSTDDVLIRLPDIFQQDEQGNHSLDIYRVNLAIVEALIKGNDVSIDPVSEPDFGVDLNRDGSIQGIVDRVVFDWAPLKERHMHYVGAARLAQQEGKVHLAAGLYPEGTEFLHSVRYIDFDDKGNTILAARMKELRYARKTSWFTYSTLSEMAFDEVRENDTWPERLRQLIGNMEVGVFNDQGWVYQGFIEAANGSLRPQTYEETAFCIGCHSGIGATSDGTFAFPRKMTASAFRKGWYHWSEKGLKGTPEPVRNDGLGEYALYLSENGAADELRENFEAIDKFFTPEGHIKPGMLEALRNDITVLIHPSRERALQLNKAYRTIVKEQSFHKGRDTTVTPAVNVHREVAQGQATGVTKVVR